MASREQLRAMVVASLRELANNTEAEITDQTSPKDDLELDSEEGVEFACEISKRMGKHFPDDLNPFVDDDARRGRTVGEIVDFLEAKQSELKPLAGRDVQ